MQNYVSFLFEKQYFKYNVYHMYVYIQCLDTHRYVVHIHVPDRHITKQLMNSELSRAGGQKKLFNIKSVIFICMILYVIS
jgi:hypothetical protein